jgi:tetratricopeptide (TPR) repeat protein
MSSFRKATLTVLALIALASAAMAQNPADEAWNRGDTDTARRLYRERLAADSSDIRALHRMALLYAWDNDFPPSLALFDKLLSISPENVDARVDRARVMAWAGRFEESIASLEVAVERHPGNRQALLGLALVLAWDNQLDSATAIYGQLIAADSSDVRGWEGFARTVAWHGDLIDAEQQWRDALSRDQDSPELLIGLSQTLRWQGRPDAAREVLDRVPLEAKEQRGYLDEARAIALGVDPRITPRMIVEIDSDDNTIATLVLRGDFPPGARYRVGLDTYVRYANWDVPAFDSRSAWGAVVTGQLFVEPGWIVGAGIGASGSNGSAASIEPALRARVSSPSRHRVGGTLTFNRSALDATALLIENGVTYTEGGISLRAQPASLWLVEAGGSVAGFQGSESNRRVTGFLAATRRISPSWAGAIRARLFGFQKNLTDGYFDPDLYSHNELIGRWRPFRGPLHLTVELAPGLEKVGKDGTFHGTIRTLVRGAIDVAPGRQVGVSALYSNAGLQSFATGQEGYRYFSVSLFGSWVF